MKDEVFQQVLDNMNEISLLQIEVESLRRSLLSLKDDNGKSFDQICVILRELINCFYSALPLQNKDWDNLLSQINATHKRIVKPSSSPAIKTENITNQPKKEENNDYAAAIEIYRKYILLFGFSPHVQVVAEGFIKWCEDKLSSLNKPKECTNYLCAANLEKIGCNANHYDECQSKDIFKNMKRA